MTITVALIEALMGAWAGWIIRRAFMRQKYEDAREYVFDLKGAGKLNGPEAAKLLSVLRALL